MATALQSRRLRRKTRPSNQPSNAESPSVEPPGFHRPLVLEITRIPGSGWLEEQPMDFLGRDRAVLDSPWNHDHFAGFQPLIAISKAHLEPTFEYQEQLIFVVVIVPHKLPLDLGQLHFLSIQFGDNAGAPMIAELAQSLSEIDLQSVLLVETQSCEIESVFISSRRCPRSAVAMPQP